MKTIMINDIPFDYPSKKEIMESISPEFKNHKMIYRFGEYISTFLDIDCPELAIEESVQRDPSTLLDAVTFTDKDFPYLKDPIIIFSGDIFVEENEKIIVGTLAHEIRHVYQDQHPNLFLQNSAYTYKDSLLNQKEIDADAFAIYIISEIYHIPIQKAGSIFCDDIKRSNKKAYNLRMVKAKKLSNSVASSIE